MGSTITQVAKIAGVSRMTVSRVMSESPSVRPETRQRVLEAMRELGYVPSPAARAMRSKDALVAGGNLCCALIFGADTGWSDGFFCDVARAAEAEAAAHGLCLLQCHWQESFEQSWPRLQSVVSMGRLCGAVLAGEFSGDEVVAICDNVDHVVVIDGPSPPGCAVGNVEADNVEGCNAALGHLLDQGARRLLVISGPYEGHYFARAMTDAAERVRHRCESLRVVTTGLSPERGYEVVRDPFRQ